MTAQKLTDCTNRLISGSQRSWLNTNRTEEMLSAKDRECSRCL